MLVDVVDNQNRVVARADRSVLLREHLNFRTVHVLLFDSDAKLVLQQLSPSHPRSPNRIGSSAAGYLLAQETYKDAAYRKLDLELGISAELQDMGEIDVADEKSRKFVGIFVGNSTQQPAIKDKYVVELVRLSIDDVAAQIVRDPEIFTPHLS